MTDPPSIRRNPFDRLPDDVVLSIFDRLHDARSLCLSMSVCKRFHSVAPHAAAVHLSLPRRKPAVLKHPETLTTLLKTLITRPFHLISRAVKRRPKPEPENDNDLAFYSHQIPNRILAPFRQIRTLHLRLPCNNCRGHGHKTTALLKWKADFGKELHSCVILGARSWSDGGAAGESETPPETRLLAEDELKLRIVWTISCLIAASARHHLVQETVRALEKVESLVVSDESDQGRLCMNMEEIAEMKGEKDCVEGSCSSEYRSKVPALKMKMWYLERVEAAGKVMEGATLVVIRPAGGGGGGVADGEMVAGAFGEDDEGVDEAVRKLMVAKKCYTLEMNSF